MTPLHEKAIYLAQTFRSSESELLFTLMEMAEQRLFIQMGYSGMWDYVTGALKLTETQASYFCRVAQRARCVPQLKEALRKGELSISKARRIVGVIDNENAEEWIHAATTLKQRELEKKVSSESPRRGVKDRVTPLGDGLNKLTVVITDEEERKLERAKDLVSQSLRKSASLKETLTTVLGFFIDRKDPVKKAERAATSSRTSKGQSKDPRFIPAEVKHEVYLREGGQCTAQDASGKRCEARRFLHLHHVVPVSQGGKSIASNLVTYCSGHHRAHHFHEVKTCHNPELGLIRQH